jgi:hypothetical protein
MSRGFGARSMSSSPAGGVKGQVPVVESVKFRTFFREAVDALVRSATNEWPEDEVSRRPDDFGDVTVPPPAAAPSDH